MDVTTVFHIIIIISNFYLVWLMVWRSSKKNHIASFFWAKFRVSSLFQLTAIWAAAAATDK